MEYVLYAFHIVPMLYAYTGEYILPLVAFSNDRELIGT